MPEIQKTNGSLRVRHAYRRRPEHFVEGPQQPQPAGESCFVTVLGTGCNLALRWDTRFGTNHNQPVGEGATVEGFATSIPLSLFRHSSCLVEHLLDERQDLIRRRID